MDTHLPKHHAPVGWSSVGAVHTKAVKRQKLLVLVCFVCILASLSAAVTAARTVPGPVQALVETV